MTLDRAVLEALAQLPPDAQLTVTLRAGDVVHALEQHGNTTAAPDPAESSAPSSWRERLWTCHPETRLGRKELAEAVGHPLSWVNRRTSSKSGYRQLPHRMHDGATIFVAGEVREWLRQCEEVVVMPTPSIVPITRRRRS